MAGLSDFVRKRLWYFVCRYVLNFFSDEFFVQITAWMTFKRFGASYTRMNLSNPLSFNEKINFVKIYKSPNYGHILADKFAVREFVKNRVGEHYLIPLLGVYSNAECIPWNDLPQQFVLKANHGSGWNIVCTDKSSINRIEATKKLNRWLGQNAFYLSREYQYKYIPPRIVCEKLIGYNIHDYKFFCFNGIPKLVQVDIGRFSEHERAFFDLEWNLQPFTICYPIASIQPEKPKKLKEMIEVSAKLSKGLDFARIDLYEHHGQVYFGEITLCPEGGKGPFMPSQYDGVLGEYLHLKLKES